MSPFSKRAMAYTMGIGVACLVAEGVNYWQGTPPSIDELRWLLFIEEVGAILAGIGLTVDLARWIWRRVHMRQNSN